MSVRGSNTHVLCWESEMEKLELKGYFARCGVRMNIHTAYLLKKKVFMLRNLEYTRIRDYFWNPSNKSFHRHRQFSPLLFQIRNASLRRQCLQAAEFLRNSAQLCR